MYEDDSSMWYPYHTTLGGITPFRLRGYQKEGSRRLNEQKRLMLTDAPGLGKTAQSAFAVPHADNLGYVADRPKVLIVAPSYLTEQWGEWLRGEDEKSMERNGGRVWPNVGGTISVATGNRYKKFQAIKEHADWTVINIEALLTHAIHLGVRITKNEKGVKSYTVQKNRRHYDVLILDEAHHLRNRKSGRAQVAVKLASVIERVYLLTATPIYREVDDLYNQFRIMHPEVFPSYNQFVDQFCVADDSRWGKQIYGVKKSMIKELEGLLDIMRIGRSYADAGRELPPIIEKFVKIELPDEVKKIYMEAVEQYKIEILEQKYTNWMSVFHALRRIITGSFKLDAVYELLADEVRKAAVFSWYQETAEAVQERISDMVIATGGDKVAVRRARAHGDKHVSATIAAMSEGIDMSDARTVIFVEENWTPGSNYQALSRVRRERIGGDNSQPITVVYVHCKGTIDEVIHRRSKTREGTIKEVVREALFL